MTTRKPRTDPSKPRTDEPEPICTCSMLLAGGDPATHEPGCPVREASRRG